MTDVSNVSNQELAKLSFGDALELYGPQLLAALPDSMPLGRFKRVFITALNQEPKLAKCDRRSLFNQLLKCALDGLYPDGREAALIAQSDGVVRYNPMIAGIRKRMRNSGEVTSAIAEVVHANDHFKYAKGDNGYIEHQPPALTEKRGDPVGAYAIIHLKNGEVIREVMPYEDIEYIRKKYSRASGESSPWKTRWSEMARKTVLRLASKQVPNSSEIEHLFGESGNGRGEMRDITPSTQADEPPLKGNAGLKAKLAQETAAPTYKKDVLPDEPSGMVAPGDSPDHGYNSDNDVEVTYDPFPEVPPDYPPDIPDIPPETPRTETMTRDDWWDYGNALVHKLYDIKDIDQLAKLESSIEEAFKAATPDIYGSVAERFRTRAKELGER